METDTGKVKFGDGSTAWNSLAYFTGIDDYPEFAGSIGLGAAPAASGIGVTFPAAQSPSADPNTLDDYEEGVWTPTVTANSGAITSYVAAGHYTKIGRQVHCTAVISITNNGTGAGTVIVTLPFAAAVNPRWMGAGRESSIGGKMLQARIDSGATTMNVWNFDNTYPAATGATLIVTISYFV